MSFKYPLLAALKFLPSQSVLVFWHLGPLNTSQCKCTLADLALLPPEREYKPNLLALLWTRLFAGDNRRAYSGRAKGWCLHCKTGDEGPGGRAEQWSLVLAGLSLFANRLLQGYFHVLHLQSLSQTLVVKAQHQLLQQHPKNWMLTSPSFINTALWVFLPQCQWSIQALPGNGCL